MANGKIEDYPEAARAIALQLKEFCDETLPYPEMIADAARKAKAALDEADRKRGQLERELDYLKDSERKRNSWLAKAKEQAGYSQNTSFDVVWAETLKKAND